MTRCSDRGCPYPALTGLKEGETPFCRKHWEYANPISRYAEVDANISVREILHRKQIREEARQAALKAAKTVEKQRTNWAGGAKPVSTDPKRIAARAYQRERYRIRMAQLRAARRAQLETNVGTWHPASQEQPSCL